MQQKTILCFGDSNTWGYVPNCDETRLKKRFNRDQRWTGILQEKLGDKFYVIEEGLNSRTTNLDYLPPERNGKIYLPPCLYSHSPIDLVILGLGSNDMKVYFDRTPSQIRDGLSELVDIILASTYGPNMNQSPQILITSVPIPHPIIETFEDEKGIKFFKGAVAKANHLLPLYVELSVNKGCHFADISSVIPSQIDGGHFDDVAHQRMAEILFKKICQIFNTII